MNCRTCAGPCFLKGSNHEGDCEGYKPRSNFERLREMSIEEMADFVAKALYGMLGGQPCLVGNSFEDCKNRWFNWLRQEAEEGE